MIPSNNQIARANGGQSVATGQVVSKNDFGSSMMTTQSTASVAVAAQAQAAVQARYIMALNRPRDWEQVRLKLLAAMKRPGFAESARYCKPIGKDRSKWPTGWSIRFAEEVVRCIGNLYPEVMVIDEGPEQRIIQQSCTDLENNVTFSNQIVVDKTVERKYLKDGQSYISSRMNSAGETTYRVAATEDDLLNKQGALLSKALRTQVLRLLPGDIQDECLHAYEQAIRGDVKEDPQAAKRKLIDAFFSVGIQPSDLAEYLGHPLERLQPAELTELRQVFTALKQGETTWEEAMEAREPQGSTEAAAEVGKAKLAAMQAQKVAKQPEPAPAPVVEPEQEPDYSQEEGWPEDQQAEQAEPARPALKLKFGQKRS